MTHEFQKVAMCCARWFSELQAATMGLCDGTPRQCAHTLSLTCPTSIGCAVSKTHSCSASQGSSGSPRLVAKSFAVPSGTTAIAIDLGAFSLIIAVATCNKASCIRCTTSLVIDRVSRQCHYNCDSARGALRGCVNKGVDGHHSMSGNAQ